MRTISGFANYTACSGDAAAPWHRGHHAPARMGRVRHSFTSREGAMGGTQPPWWQQEQRCCPKTRRLIPALPGTGSATRQTVSEPVSSLAKGINKFTSWSRSHVGRAPRTGPGGSPAGRPGARALTLCRPRSSTSIFRLVRWTRFGASEAPGAAFVSSQQVSASSPAGSCRAPVGARGRVGSPGNSHHNVADPDIL